MSRWRPLALSAAIAVVMMASISSAAAQTTGGITGVVVDPSGGAIVGAEVVVQGAAGVPARQVATDGTGTFTVKDLPAGHWVVEVRSKLFESRRLEVDLPESGLPWPTLRVELGVGAVSEQVTILGPAAYTSRPATSATKTSVPLLETPRAVQVVARDVIDDRVPTTILAVVKNVSGVQAPPGGYYDNFYIRGFSTVVDTYRNGLRLNSMRGAPDMAFVDHVEVAKGPSSMLFGRVQPGGIVNTVTKTPQATRAFGISQQFESWGTVRTSVDATGALTKDHSLLYRVIGAYDKGEYFIDNNQHRNVAFAAYLTWIPSARIALNLHVERYDKKMTNVAYTAQQIPAIGNRPADLPRNWTQNDPVMWSDFPATEKATLVPYDLTVALTSNWKVTNRLGYSDLDDVQSMMTPLAFTAATGMMTRRINYNAIARTMVTTNLDLTGAITTGVLRHRVLLGVDYIRHRTTYKGYRQAGPGATPGVPALNVYAPVYGNISNTALHAVIDPSLSNILYYQNINNTGVYVQDQVSLGRRWEVLGGARWDRTFDPVTVSSKVGVTTATCYPACDGTLDPNTPTETAVSPNAGVLFKVSPDASVYASYAKSFGNSNGSALTFDGTRPPPQSGVQYEVGAKAALMRQRLTTSLTVFDLRQRNRMTADLDHVGFSIPVGEVRNRGVEFDVAGQMSSRVSVIASYTYADARITKDNTVGANATLGKRMNGIPVHSSSLWLKYGPGAGAERGWSVGAGLSLNGLRQGNNTNTFQLPGYGKVDAMASYRLKAAGRPVVAQLNVQNVLDAQYFEATDGSTNSYYGAPRAVSTSIKFQF